MSDLSVAFELLAVGMITVFIILFLVYLIGYTIILTVNKYFPNLEPATTKVVKSTTEISQKNIAVLTAVIHKITSGKGRISHVEKLKK